MAENSINNPFVECTARDMRFAEVKQYWCSPFSLYNLNESELFLSRTPIVIEGIRGSGKTMILKYLSYPVQKNYIEDLSLQGKLVYLQTHSFGTYFRYKGDFCNLFEMIKCSQDLKERIFKQYFDLFVAREMIDNINILYEGKASSEMLTAVSSALNISSEPLNSAIDFINSQIKLMDGIMNKSAFDRNWQNDIVALLRNDDLIHNIVSNISEKVPGWKSILFSVILDEYENLGNLQDFVNTLIKRVDEKCNLTYRIGMRPAGMERDNSTRIGIEKLQVDRDYLIRKLVFQDFSEYKKFAFEVSHKRLCNTETYRERKLTSIDSILGKNEDIDYEAKETAKGTKHFNLIDKKLSPEEFKNAKKVLSNDEKLLEMYNILLVSRGTDYLTVAKTCKEYLTLREEKKLSVARGATRKYYLGYSDKYRLALLFVLRALYGEKKWYYSVNTFLYLSSGSINDFISLCRNTFKYVNFEILRDMEEGKPISPIIQTYGAMDTAEDQRRKVAQSNNHGSEMYSFIENLGGVFEEYHRDTEIKYPETNQFAFTNENQIRNDRELGQYLIDLINSGAIIRRQNRQLKSIGHPRGNIYQLNRIFAPLYQYSYRTRGGYNQMISTELFRDMLHESVSPLRFLNKEAECDQSAQNGYDQNDPQISIFEYMEGGIKTDGSSDI